MAISRRRLSLRAKLLMVFIAIGAFVLAVLLIGTLVMRDAEMRQQRSVAEGVRPLVGINRIQSQINRIRMLEIELLQLTDYFAITSQLDLLRSEQGAVTRELEAFIGGLGQDSALAGRGLAESWRRYQNDLQQLSEAAMAMHFDEARRIATFDSVVRFRLISRGLQQLAERADDRADEALRQAAAEYGRQRNVFILASLGGLMLIALWLSLLARSTTVRLARLQEAAGRIAAGDFSDPVRMGGTDELANLAKAFNTMQQQLMAREHALAAARDELEQRVEQRTGELNETNMRLLYEIAERSAAEEQLRLLSVAVEQTPVSIMITDVAGHIRYVNRAFMERTGYAREEIFGRTPRLLKSDTTPADEYESLWQSILSGQQWEGDFLTRRRDGSEFWERVHISPVTDSEGRITHFLAVRQDVSERKAQEELVRHQAHYDGLTGLPNRLLTMDRLGQAIHAAEREQRKVVLMFVDLDDFKKVNDTLGHEAGDDLLVQAALRLSESVRGEDIVGRHGGDEFLVIMGELASAAEAEIVAGRIIEAFQLPFVVAGKEVTISTSIGLASYPDDASAPAILLRYADRAMYDAKEAGRNMYRYFDQASHDQAIGYLDFERTLRAGLTQEEFWLAYQPLVEAKSGRLLGVEALLRWNSREYGKVGPDRFIPVAERSGFILELGSWALMTACSMAVHWMQNGCPPFVMSVNVSPRQFRGDQLLNDVKQCLRATGLAPECLQIEITEGVLMQKRPEVEAVLRGLNELGVQIALDDFGTGYASLSYLKRFPFHTLKIDREFIRDLVSDEGDRALVTAAVRMGKALGLAVVAEGVESREQAQWLADAGCDSLQGYFFDRPLMAEEFEARWLHAPQAVPGAGSAAL